jgi:hypothetical protein
MRTGSEHCVSRPFKDLPQVVDDPAVVEDSVVNLADISARTNHNHVPKETTIIISLIVVY